MKYIYILFIIGVITFFIYKYGAKNQNYWKIRGVNYARPIVSFVGGHATAIFRPVNVIKFNTDLYNRFKEKFFGIFMFSRPSLMVNDADLLKQIMVNDADYFLNRFNCMQNIELLLSKNLSLLKVADEQWKQLRMVMTTVFTGAKMKDMFGFMEACGNQAAENMLEKINRQIENKDAIASTAFGLEVDSFKNPNNEFFQIGMDLRRQFKAFSALKTLFTALFPRISRVLKLTSFRSKVNNFFSFITSETVQKREKYNIIRKDVIHALTEAKKRKHLGSGELLIEKLADLNENDVQAMYFLFGGFDKIAKALIFMCYEMAMNPDIQEKLYEDVEQVARRENGATYDGVINHMQYLDMMVKEILRKWPPVLMTNREVSKNYVIPKSEDCPEVTLSRGDTIMIPILGLHRDPEYYPEPEKFDPERFRDEKNTIKPFTYLPFDAGIKHCIGMRYAIMEIKIGIVCLIRRFWFVSVRKTAIPEMTSQKKFCRSEPENKFWIGFQKRE